MHFIHCLKTPLTSNRVTSQICSLSYRIQPLLLIATPLPLSHIHSLSYILPLISHPTTLTHSNPPPPLSCLPSLITYPPLSYLPPSSRSLHSAIPPHTSIYPPLSYLPPSRPLSYLPPLIPTPPPLISTPPQEIYTVIFEKAPLETGKATVRPK